MRLSVNQMETLCYNISGSREQVQALFEPAPERVDAAGGRSGVIPDALWAGHGRGEYNTGNKWEVERLFYAGTRGDRFMFFGYELPTGEKLVFAGCRAITLSEARSHWQEGAHPMHDRTWPFLTAIAEFSSTRAAVPVLEDVRANTLVHPGADVEAFMGKLGYSMFLNWLNFAKPGPRNTIT